MAVRGDAGGDCRWRIVMVVVMWVVMVGCDGGGDVGGDGRWRVVMVVVMWVVMVGCNGGG